MSNPFVSCVSLLAGCLLSAQCCAQRLPVLGQIDAPHPYYFREMYLPQLTSGPSSVTWSPDSREIIYSMAGSLWRQRLGTEVAQQLTAGAGYDYQPDWSPDGRWVVYSSYRGDAVELWVLDLQNGMSRAITANGAVNVEPRVSPDGKRVVFVSTLYNRRFHLFMADLRDAEPANPVRLTGEHKSELPRYYYSAFDHEINPLWTRDGRDIIFVSNRNHIYGTGGFWRMPASAGGEAHEIHTEETNWKARPDVSPDGSRLVYSSYLGRAWHNLWLMPSGGGDAFPLAYADWDQTNPRFAPDGRKIAYISNQNGNTQICIESIPGGDLQTLSMPARRYLHPTAKLHIELRAVAGGVGAARISVTDAAGRFYAPADAWVHADDGFDRRHGAFEAHYFHVRGEASIDVPIGVIQVQVMHGFERKFEQHRITMRAGASSNLVVDLNEGRWRVPDAGRWVSADVHVHMNYGGVYRNTPAHLSFQAEAEDLGLVHSLIVNKEQRFPDIPYSGMRSDTASQPDALVVHGQEFHTSYWGHLGLLDIAGGIILPGYAGYPGTAAASLFPMNADIADIAHARGALVGYVHPFDEPPQPLSPHAALTNELPVDVALGKIDYMEILGFSDHRATAEVWYRLLNLGFRIPAAGGTDAMANFASLRGPVGMNRVYVRIGEKEAVDAHRWLEGLKQGRSFATNGPLLGFALGGAGIGEELKFATAPQRVPFTVRLKSIVAVDALELVCNGRSMKSLLNHRALAQGEFHGSIVLHSSGWCVLRASTAGAAYPVLDNYAYATTSPIYITIAGRAPHSAEDARFFAAWVARVIESTSAYPDWNDAAEKRGVLARLSQAKAAYLRLYSNTAMTAADKRQLP